MRGSLAAALVLTVGVSAAGAQVIRVSGSIADDAGKPVRGAAITAENPDQTPPRLTATSNDKGEFGFIGVRRGMWTLTVEAPGFERLQFRHSVTTGRQRPIDVRLAPTPAPVTLPLDGIKAADIQQRIARAEAFASSGDLDAAIAAWNDVLARVPALTSVYLQVGALYERKPDPQRAIASYRKLLELEPANARAQAAVERLQRQQ